MPKSTKFDESSLLKACEAAQAQEKPNITKIAREHGVPYATLRDRVKKGRQPRTARKPVNKLLEGYQEEALRLWLVHMRDSNMPVTPRILEAWANRALIRAGKPDQQVSKMWAYHFEKRLPAHLKLGPVKQKTKESRRIRAEDAGLLSHWYNLLANIVKDAPAWLVYNFDECGFQPGEGISRNVIGSKDSCPDLAEAERGENITAVECIAADGWQMDPFFIFKGNGIFMESWFNKSEALLPHTIIGTSPNGWITDELAFEWLQHFIRLTNGRTKRGEKRILIFNGHGSHLTFKFLQECEDNGIIPFGFMPHTTHLYQPLDGKLFLSYKQHFRRMNNDLSYWAGEPVGKSEFLWVIGPVQEKAFNQQIIREAFKDRGIWPVAVDGGKIVENLANQVVIPDIYAPDLRAYGENTPSPSPSRPLSSSSIDVSPPQTIQALEKNQAKISKHTDVLTPKIQRNLQRIFEHNRIAAEHLAMANDTISQIRAAQAPLRRQYTKRQVKPLSQTGILKIRDANRSIAARKAKETAAEERRLQRQWEKLYGKKAPPPPTQESEISIEAARVAEENGEVFFYDSQPMR